MSRTHHLSLVRRLTLALSLVVLLTLVGAAALSSGPTARAQTLPPATPVIPPAPPVPPVPPAPPVPSVPPVPPVPPVLPLPSNRIRVPVTQPSELFSEGRRCAIIVTPDDFTRAGTLRLIEVPLELLMYRTPALVYLRACEVEYRETADNAITARQVAPPSDEGNLISAFQFAQPIEACFPYDQADLTRAQGSAERFTVVAFDPFRQVWVELPLTLDQATRRICGQLPGSGIVALAIRPARAATLPGTSGNLPEGTPTAAAVAVAAPAAAQPAPTAQPTAAPVATAAAAAAAAPGEAATAPDAAAPVAPAPAGGLLPGSPAASAVNTTSPQAYLPLGLLIAAAVAAAIIVLSRNFIRRGREDEGE